MNYKALMLASVLSAGSALASNLNISLDVIVRDFQPRHPDFENFSEESVAHLQNIYDFSAAVPLAGYGADWYGLSAYHNSCGNKASYAKYGVGVPLGKDGLPMSVNALLPSYLQQVSAYAAQGKDGILTYGQCKNSSIAGVTNQRGFGENTATQFRGVQKNSCEGDMYWENEVIYTPGMVNPHLTFDMDTSGTPLYLEGAHIHKLGELCDNANFGQWFEDVSGVNKRSNLTLDIPNAADDPNYKELDYNYNNGGYFPLDVIDPATMMYTGQMPGSDQWGPQSLSIFCPPYDYEYAFNQADYRGQITGALCNAWLMNGGPRSGDAALKAATATWSATYYTTGEKVKNTGLGGEGSGSLFNVGKFKYPYVVSTEPTLGYQHLRNYNFTMMGYANFRYYKDNNTDETNQEIFEFAGDDDMWIFVDGVLAVDLGGTHLATPGVVNIRTLAQNNHGCHDGEPLAAVQQGKGACGADGQWADGSWHHLHFFYADRQSDGSNLYIRANLSEVAASAYGQPRIQEAELVKNDEGTFDTYIYLNTQLAQEVIEKINSANGNYFPILAKRGSDTLAYQVTGFKYVQKTSKGYSYEIKGKLCEDATCASLKNPAFGDSLAFNYIPSPDFPDAYNNQFHTDFPVFSATGKLVDHYSWGPVTTVTMSTSTTIVPADTTIVRPPFDVDQLPNGELSDRETGEIIISKLPESYSNSEDPAAWIADSLVYYTTASPDNPHATVLNSKTSNSPGSMSEARCSATNGVENCVSFNFVTDEAFRVNIRIFDHLGHFVNQYNQEVSQEEFNKLTGSYTPNEICSDKTGTGTIAASVKMYPVSKDGRKLGTGAYIYQISLVEYPQPHCVNVGGEQSFMPGEYRRTEYKQTRGFRRVE